MMQFITDHKTIFVAGTCILIGILVLWILLRGKKKKPEKKATPKTHYDYNLLIHDDFKKLIEGCPNEPYGALLMMKGIVETGMTEQRKMYTKNPSGRTSKEIWRSIKAKNIERQINENE